MTMIDRAYAERQKAAERLKRDEATYELADAWIGLDSLLKGAWGTENLNALGGGKTQIEKAHRVLGDLIKRASGVSGGER